MFHVSALEQDTTRKGQVSKEVQELDAGNENSEKYEVEAIWDSAVYANESESGYLPGLYYLVTWKGYPKEENTWESSSAVQHLKKLISSFHKDHPEKLTATFPCIDSAPPMAGPIVKPTAKTTTKQKRGRPANNASKQAKNWAHTVCRDNPPFIRWGLDGFSLLFASFLSSLQERWFSSSNNLTRLGGFLPIATHKNNYLHRSIFPPQFPLG